MHSSQNFQWFYLFNLTGSHRRIATISLARPKRLNAIDDVMPREIAKCVALANVPWTFSLPRYGGEWTWIGVDVVYV